MADENTGSSHEADAEKGAEVAVLPLSASNAKDEATMPEKLLRGAGTVLNSFAGTEKLQGFNPGEIFSETFKRRTSEEIEDYLTVGTKRTTPLLTEVQTGWPKPWLFSRCLLVFGLTYIGFVVAFTHFGSQYAVPGLIIMGAFAAPMSTLVFFFELNTPRNVSLYPLLMLVLFGGIASLLFSLVGQTYSHLDWLGALDAGVIEEPAKLAALVLIARSPRHPYILNGLLFGAAVGSGFGAFESAGYSFAAGLADGGDAMIRNIGIRGLVAPSMHSAWTAIVGGALWRVTGGKAISFGALTTPSFCRVLVLAAALHTLWNIPFELPFFIKEIVLGMAVWFVIVGLVQQGLRQMQREQRALIAANAPKTKAA